MSTIEVSRIALLSHDAFDGKPWYGTSLCKLLEGVTAECAAAHPISGAHSIWEEVLHAITWRTIVIRLLSGETVAPVTLEENWPKVPDSPSATAWQQTLDELARTQGRLEAALVALTDERLPEKASENPRSFYELAHGIIQHDAYHAGQIALIKNASA